ncbi:DinB family protein [Paenibacillus alkalitolerans]|uniref:DinB family protein n=1 Tax=Paenibacillus alkalitolerans TaxID=2799335 RepID=UPI001F25E9DD|nr:DinB family protein [Paenibacillus alkalitolerans]
MKHYDFTPDDRMFPVVGLLHSMVTYNYHRLKLLVDGLTQVEIDYKGPHEELNSIAQLLRHLAVVDLHWVYRLQAKDVPQEYRNRFGPMYDNEGKLPMVKDVPLEKLLEEYDEIQEMFRQICLKLTDNDLNTVVPYGNGQTAAIRWGIWHIADHSRHHYADIVRLKKMIRK